MSPLPVIPLAWTTRASIGVSLLFLAACGGGRSAERYVSMDGVDRFPRVRQRHTEVVLAPDRSIRHLTMLIRTPSAPLPKDRERLVTAEFGRDTLVLTVRDSSGTNSIRVGMEGALLLPHVSQMYGLAEVYIGAALARGKAMKIHAGDSVTVAQFYPDDDPEHFRVHDGWVQRLGGDTVEIWHGMISGVGLAMLDSSGRLMRYSGAQSTYKVDVRRVTVLPDVKTLGAQFAAAEQRTGAAQLSVRDTVRASIGQAQFTVDYGRPLARGRTLVGDVIDLDAVWRTGANAATQFTTSAPVTLAGIPLAPGGYTLWTVPRAHGAELVVNRQTGQWGTEYDPAFDLGKAPLNVEAGSATVEMLTISITPADARHGTLLLAWGTFQWSAPIVVR